MAELNRPKICFVGLQNLPVLAREYNSHGIGGEQVQQTLLAKAFAQRGYDVSMIVADYGQPEGAVWDGVKTIKGGALSGGIRFIRHFHPGITDLWRALKRADADVYYASCAGRHIGILAAFKKKYGRKLVFRVAHDSDCEPANLLIRYWWDKRMYEYGLRRADSILLQSAQQAESLGMNYGLTGRLARMLVEPGVMDLKHGDRMSDVLWVNNLRPFKRPDLLLELAESLGEVSFDMVGGALPRHAALYKEISDRSASIGNLRFHGQVPYHDVNDFYERAKLFVNTSDSEGFPNSYLQAWSRGTPVIAFFDPDGVIRREELGYVPASIKEMRDVVRHLVNSPEEWERLSRACRNFMRQHYDVDDILSPYMTEFQCRRVAGQHGDKAAAK